MIAPRRPVLFGARFLGHLRHLVGVYWTSSDAKWALPLLAGAIVLELGAVYGNLLLSDAERRIMDAVGDRQGAAFLAAIGLFGAVSAGFVLVSAYRVYLRQLVEIPWRRGVTSDYLARWMGECAYCQMLSGNGMDNPDQRIAEDVRDFVASALGLSLSLLTAVATLISFGGLLWNLSGRWALPVGAAHVHVPGILLWIALFYAAVSTWLTHRVGRRLVPLNFDRLRYEADFRHGLMRFRDNVERVTLSGGEALERRGALGRFRNVMRNWSHLIAAQRNLTLFTGVIAQANGVVPLLVAAPAFFAGMITLGVVAQIRFAYGQVSGALNWFVYAYQEIARWRANLERLSTFTEVIDATARERETSGIDVVRGERRVLRVSGLHLVASDGRALLDVPEATIGAGEHVLIVGPSGSGKTVLLRAIAGIWPFGTGRIELPAGARLMFLPQWPYLPVESLRTVASYPAPEGSFPDDRIVEGLGLLGLERLAIRLDDTAQWDQQLSPSEQQRLAMVRVLLNEPDWVFLDKATSALDEAMETRVYGLLAERLPRATMISVAHRPGVPADYARRWTITPSAEGASALQAA